MFYKWIVVTDIDNTLTGDARALRELKNKLDKLRDSGDLYLILSTGRHLDQVIDGFEEEGIPYPDAVISQVGTEIYLPPFNGKSIPLESWNRLLVNNFNRESALSAIEGISGIRLQPPEFNTELKLSFYVESKNSEEKVKMVTENLKKESNQDNMVIWSSGQDLDVIPAASGKGNAIRYIVDMYNFDPQSVVVAGDSGNDISMFESFDNGIIVGNAQTELKKYGEDNLRAGLYLAESDYAKGVTEGLQHFEIL